MFSNDSDNYNMLLGAYKKLKTYYHYNKNFLFMREKIASFEYDDTMMDSQLHQLAQLLIKPSKYVAVINKWIESIDYYVLPKTFTVDKSLEERFVTSTLPDKSVTRVNFFIDMPIELHLLEIVWTMFVAKIAFDNNVFQKCCYGNAVDDNVLFDKSTNDLKKSIRFPKNRLFKIYFPQYCNWKNNAINIIDNYKNKKDTVLISLDIKSFFYSIRWNFDLLYKIVPDSRLDDIKELTRIIKQIFEKYTRKIGSVRELSQRLSKKESVLPIGLFSSMLLSNIYMSTFDIEVLKQNNVLYYGRYVDDILLLLNVEHTGFKADDDGLDKLLVTDNKVLSKLDIKNYNLCGYEDLLIQREKMKVVFLEHGKCEGIVNQLKNTKLIPSQMNSISDNDTQMIDFEEAAYALHNFSTKTKIRDLGHLEINTFKLASHMIELVRGSKFKTISMKTKEERDLRKEEIKKVIKFFGGSNAIEYNSNWINAFYFILLSSDKKKKEWYKLETGIRDAIKNIKISRLEDINKGKSAVTKSRMKKNMSYMLDICIATALSINPGFSKKEKNDIIDMCYKIRNANLFNHYLVAFPLMNYSDSIESDVDLSNLTLATLKKDYFKIYDSRKIKLSPRFINFDELFFYNFIRNIVCKNSGFITDRTIQKIRNVFLDVNNIDSSWAKPLSISIVDEKGHPDGYNFEKISLFSKKRNLNQIRIAVANIKLDIDSCCMGLHSTPVIRNRLDFIEFLEQSSKKNTVDYLVFPEYYLPLSWIPDILTFSRKTGVTVITGIQFISDSKEAHNVVGVFTRVKSGKYNSSCAIFREKNNYAPLEKQILATEGYEVHDKKNPIYTCFDDGGVRFGLFLCYEFTDIRARGLFKDNADIIFIPEYNSDTNYFSNIIDTMTRDIHAFMVQSNTSNYGDSRISGPFNRDFRNIVQIKGGDNDNLIIGTINVQETINYRIKERKEMVKDIKNTLLLSKKERMEKKSDLLKSRHDKKIEKTSARTFF